MKVEQEVIKTVTKNGVNVFILNILDRNTWKLVIEKSDMKESNRSTEAAPRAKLKR
jgi:hypothetical protein